MAAGPEFETIRLDIDDGVAVLTLHRPDRLNAFTGQMAREIVAAFDHTDTDDCVRAVIVTGAGRGFCAGADLSSGGATFDYKTKEGRGGAGADGDVDLSDESVRDTGGRVALRIFESLKPVIGAINGPAVGIGATMTLPMDVRIASDNARFGFVFARRGIVPEACSSWFLPRVVGVSQALEWSLSGRVFDAGEALAGRLVRQVVAPEALMGEAMKLAREIVDHCAPVSVALIRQMMWRMLGADHPMEAHKLDSKFVFMRGRGADAKEGVTSFLEKRPARFTETVSRDMPKPFPWWDERGYE
jgi:enoyl-CoA hydratase/carnithine racemase